jgi:hypothetical protein
MKMVYLKITDLKKRIRYIQLKDEKRFNKSINREA